MRWPLLNWLKPLKNSTSHTNSKMIFKERLQSKWLVILIFVFLASSVFFYFTYDRYETLHTIEPAQAPIFSDDLKYASLVDAAKSHAAYLHTKGSHAETSFGSINYPASWLRKSVQFFSKKLMEKPNEEELQTFIIENFDIYQAGGRKKSGGRQMLVTGYYEPLFEASLTKSDPYIYPIYSPPDTLITTLKDGGGKQIGRMTSKGFSDYWTRAEIETGNLAKGYELAYLKDPFDAYLLQVQGSGRIKLPDNTVKTVRFATSNGLTYNSIGKLLVDEDILPLEQVTVPAIRQYLTQNPTDLQRVLHHNPRFIFFNWGDDLGPRGSSGTVLTPGRSIATDQTALPDGAIAYLESKKPVVNHNGEITEWSSMKRFVFPQDSGAAIKGTGRVDMFWGHGLYAELAASHMKEPGKLYFLVKKGYSPYPRISSTEPSTVLR